MSRPPKRFLTDISEFMDRLKVMKRSIKNNSFEPGEEINLEISWLGLKIAEIKSSVDRKTLPGGSQVYQIDCTAKIQTFFLDKTEKWIAAVDPDSLCPLQFERIIIERGEKMREKLQYDTVNARAFFQREIRDLESGRITQIRRKELAAAAETQNVLSAFYLIRALDWGKGQSRTLPIVNDKDFIEEWRCECRGRETVNCGRGDKPALKFELVTKPVEKEKAGKEARIWLSDDAKRRPLRIEIDCKIGTLVANPVEAKNNFNPD